MRVLRWMGISGLVLAASACTSWDKYVAGESQKYSGSALFTMYEEWGTPVVRTRLLSGGRFYQFQKQNTDCQASVWTNDLDIVQRVAVAGPTTCSAGW